MICNYLITCQVLWFTMDTSVFNTKFDYKTITDILLKMVSNLILVSLLATCNNIPLKWDSLPWYQVVYTGTLNKFFSYSLKSYIMLKNVQWLSSTWNSKPLAQYNEYSCSHWVQSMLKNCLGMVGILDFLLTQKTGIW
jgi:UDP-galactopyranose mutase